MAELPGIDYSQYQNWEVMQAPTGATYYVVPGTGYVYDPFLSNAKGRPVLFTNPRPLLEAKKKEEDAIKKQNSFAGQAAQLGGPIGGALLGSAALKYGDKFVDWTMKPNKPTTTIDPGVTPTTTAPTEPGFFENLWPSSTPTTEPATTSAAQQGFQSSVSSSAPSQVGTSMDGGAMMSDGTVAAPPPPPMGAAPFYVPAAVAAATAATGQYAYDRYINGNRAADKTPSGKFGRAQLAFTTMGLSELANATGLGRESTKDTQKRRWGGLAEKGIVGADAAYAANHPGDDDGVWKTGKYAGQKWTFEKAADLAKSDPSHFRSVYGNLDTFGNDWNSYTDAQKDSITAGLLKANLYSSKKGDVIVTDQDKARQIKDQVLGITKQAPVPDPASAVELGKKLGTRLNKK